MQWGFVSLFIRFSRVWLCDPLDCIPPRYSVHGILQARILEWVAISLSRGSSRPRDRTSSLLCLLHGQLDSLPLSRLGSFLCSKIPMQIPGVPERMGTEFFPSRMPADAANLMGVLRDIAKQKGNTEWRNAIRQTGSRGTVELSILPFGRGSMSELAVTDIVPAERAVLEPVHP